MRDIRGETLYHILVDRFADGDPTNNAGPNGACTDPERRNPKLFWGGDLQGVIDKTDYLARLGVSCLWLSPVVEQMPALGLERGQPTAAFHGCWARDYRRLDPHLVPPAERDRPFSARDTVFDRLVRRCHDVGLRLVLELVCSHSHPGGEGVEKGELRDDGAWLTSAERDELGWYRRDRLRGASPWAGPPSRSEPSGPAVFDESSPSLRAYLRAVALDWLDRGADGIFFDHVNRMPLWFWQEMTSTVHARRRGSSLLGGWYDRAPEDAEVDLANRAGMHLLDSSFQRRVVEALCWRDVGGFRRIVQYFERDERYEDATSLVTCLDHPGTPRLLSCGLRPDHLPLALVLLMTSRGVPCIQYGTEQGARDEPVADGEASNRPMMPGFSLDGEAARALPRLAALRRENLAVQRGFFRTLWLSDEVLVFARAHRGDRVVVALNKGGETSIDVADVPLADGPAIDLLHGVGVTVRGRRIEGLKLGPGAALVFAQTESREPAASSVLCRLSGYRTRFGESVVVTGDAPELGEWDLARAVPLEYVNPNLWMGDLAFDRSAGEIVLYKYAVVDQRGNAVRESRMARMRTVPLESEREWADRWGEDWEVRPR
jgi:cyclomaltodextrin glucanotransferase